jgi:hypothetical protein
LAGILLNASPMMKSGRGDSTACLAAHDFSASLNFSAKPSSFATFE